MLIGYIFDKCTTETYSVFAVKSSERGTVEPVTYDARTRGVWEPNRLLELKKTFVSSLENVSFSC